MRYGSCSVLLALLVLSSPAAGAGTRWYSSPWQQEVERSPGNYIGALVEVVADCEIRREGACLDRVRIVEIMAQPAAPARQRAAGDDFFLYGGSEPSTQAAGRVGRMLVFAVPASTSVEPTGYGASFLSTSTDDQTVDLFRNALLGIGTRH